MTCEQLDATIMIY